MLFCLIINVLSATAEGPAVIRSGRLVKSGHLVKSARLDKKREEMSLIFL